LYVKSNVLFDYSAFYENQSMETFRAGDVLFVVTYFFSIKAIMGVLVLWSQNYVFENDVFLG